MRTWFIYGFIVILVIVAGGLGYLIYQRQFPNNSPLISKVSTSPNTPPTPTAAPYSDSYLSQLTDDEKKILQLNLNTSDAVKNNAQLIAKVAKNSDALDITNCEPKPLVIKLKLNSPYKIQNGDSTSHTILSGDYKVEASSGANLVIANFTKGTGIYGYSCDKKGLRGLMYVVN